MNRTKPDLNTHPFATRSVDDILAILDAELPEYRVHAVRVRDIVAMMLTLLDGVSGDDEQVILDAALLHDIGKADVPIELLQRPGPLTESEMTLVRSHAGRGADFLATNAGLEKGALLVRHHHEWWNGGGYPDGLAGEAIPLGSRLIGVADSYDAMTSDRPYRRAMCRSVAIAELERCRGSQFDPDLIDLVLPLLSSESL